MFYPLSKITPNLYTSGNEYFVKDTQVDYKGYYYSAYDGRFFTEKTPANNSVELIKYSALINRAENAGASLYNKLSNSSTTTSNTAQYTPTPTEADYNAGVIQRYFLRRVNGDASSIREVSKEDFSSIKLNPLYTQVEITWTIKGPAEDTPLPGGLSIPGAVNKNYQAIFKAEKQLPELLTFIKDLSEFVK